MKAFVRIVARDVAAAFAGGTVALPVVFFLMIATLYPFAVGPDGALLARTGGGVLWVAALLATLLPIDRLVVPDAESGVLDQYAVRGVSDEIVALAKMVAHWLAFGPALLLACLPAAALLRLEAATLETLMLGLFIGTPGLAALGVLVAALTAGLRRGAALAGLLVLPLAMPIVIFGAGSLATGGVGGLKLLAAASLFLVAIAPFAAGAALRVFRD